MDSYKSLYKNSRFHTVPEHNKINRELQEAKRIKRRRDGYQASRNISPSPVRIKQETNSPENKEISNPNSSRLAMIACNSNDSEKLTKFEAFLTRFVQWKEQKKIKKSITTRKRPFVSTVNSGVNKTMSSTLVPIGHHKGFRAPDGLKILTKKEKVKKSKTLTPKRRSTYTFVPTPPKKQTAVDAKLSNNKKIIQKSVTKSNNEIPHSSSLRNYPKLLEFKKAFPAPSSTTASFKRSTAAVVKGIAAAPPHSSTTASLEKSTGALTKAVASAQPPSSTSSLKRPTGAIAKAKKRMEAVKQTKKSPFKATGARLAHNLKAKKTNTKNCKKIIINTLKANELDDDMLIKTPRDFLTLNPFEEFVTSTKLKTTSHIKEDMNRTHLKESTQKKSHCTSAAKRNILGKSTVLRDCDNNFQENGAQSIFKKHNFVRYSELTDIIDNDGNSNGEIEIREDKIKGENEHTPIKLGPEEKPVNYLSPFVSISRGKVSLKKEKENRNSLYLQNTISELNTLPKEGTNENTSLKYSVEVRRTLEAVRYFRKQLQDEIDRLHKLCDIWERYKEDNLEKIQNANGEDMINVTVGQTRLLTSKKFMQFKGLIDRCEAGATGNGAVECDGSEDTKPITSGDLEGFWSMLGIQIDNLEKRFDNLNRWKINEWKDPDEEIPKIKKNLTKVKKAKSNLTVRAKPNSALQEMLRRMRENKNKNNDLNEIVSTTPKVDHRRSNSYRKSINASSSRRLSIVVKDRKYFSPAATVISVLSPNRVTSKDSPNLIKQLQSSSELRKSTLINENSRCIGLKLNTPKNLLDYNNKENVGFSDERGVKTSAVTTGRKSILKTPGTPKSRLRNVIFNERLRVRKFNFFVNETGGEFNAESCQETNEDLVKNSEDDEKKDTPLRTLTLRTRKVRLRPSCEIIIPKK